MLAQRVAGKMGILDEYQNLHLKQQQQKTNQKTQRAIHSNSHNFLYRTSVHGPIVKSVDQNLFFFSFFFLLKNTQYIFRNSIKHLRIIDRK